MSPLKHRYTTMEGKLDKQTKGRAAKHWKSLDQALGGPEYRRWAEDEFPHRDTMLEVDRRDFLKYMGAATLMASLAGCRMLPADKIVPHVRMVENDVPGKSQYFATTFVHAGYGVGVLAESRHGRPIKLEGNELHPASLGSTDAVTQASIYGLYDPKRSQEVLNGRVSSTFDEFLRAFQAAAQAKPGGVVLLTENVTSPTTGAQIDRFLKAFPGARWFQYEPVNRDSVYEGTRLAFRASLNPVYRFDQANVVLSLDADFLSALPGSVRYARDFSARRKLEGMDASGLNRLYAVESVPGLAGAAADHRRAIRATEVAPFARWVASQVGVPVSGALPASIDEVWAKALIQDLTGARGAGIVVAGEHQSPEVHALAHAINAQLGNIGKTVSYTAPPEYRLQANVDAIRGLTAALNEGGVGALVILGGDPVVTAPADLEFRAAIAKATFSAHIGPYRNETARTCQWHVPESNYLETWGDARAFDGTVSLLQPLIAPLYGTLSGNEVLERLSGGARLGKEIVFETWKSELAAKFPGKAAADAFDICLHDGLIPDSALPLQTPALSSGIGNIAASQPAKGLEAVFLPDPWIHDGRYGDNPWLLELPRPLTTLTWDNAVLMSPRTAEQLGLKSDQWVEVKSEGRSVKGMVFLSHGQADGVIALHLGFGHSAGAPLQHDEEERGFSAYALRTCDAPSIGSVVEITALGGEGQLAETQQHFMLPESRYDLVRSGTVSEFVKNPNMPGEDEEPGPLPSLYNENEFAYEGHKWAMTIDLNLCIGCGACTAACNAENNIPAVGKKQVMRGREMHWIRVDRYYKGPAENPEETVFMPVPCMHCENAPCEPVCPVAATTHSKEGLNQMVYNRCVGTRYCSNNCPYKVRRFNFLNFADKKDYPTLTLLNNPDVTVRGRGVMEKCTYCVQRISAARIESKKRGTPIEDGEIVTACQQACPTKAIVFGDISKPDTAVSKSRANPRNYSLLRELNTRPRTTYLTRVRNPHPDLERSEAHGD